MNNIFKYTVTSLIGITSCLLMLAEHFLKTMSSFIGNESACHALTFLLFVLTVIGNIYLIFFWEKKMIRTIIMQVLFMWFITGSYQLGIVVIEGVVLEDYDVVDALYKIIVLCLTIYGMYITATFKNKPK